MSDKFKCSCGSDSFEVLMNTHDQVLYSATVYKDGTVDTIDFLKDYVGDTELTDEFECAKCGRTFNLAELNDIDDSGQCVEI